MKEYIELLFKYFFKSIKHLFFALIGLIVINIVIGRIKKATKDYYMTYDEYLFVKNIKALDSYNMMVIYGLFKYKTNNERKKIRLC